MAMNDYTFSEDSGTVEVCAEITLGPSVLECDVVATLTFTDGSKASKLFCSHDLSLVVIIIGCHFPVTVQNMDYSAADPLNVTFASGSTNDGDTACASVMIMDDAALEGSHFFTVAVSNLELNPGGTYPGLMVGVPSSAPINIVDNDSMSTV